MVTRLNPYLNFEGQARAALELYHRALGGELNVMTLGEGGMTDDPAAVDLVMHGSVVTESGLTIFASDTPPSMPTPTRGTQVSVSLSSDDTDLRPVWDALAADGTVTVPFEPAPWGDRFGMLDDAFGVPWLFDQAGHL